MADRYPEGKINQDDEGELELKTVLYPVSWIGFTHLQSATPQKALIKNAEEAKRQIADLKPVRSLK